MLQVRRVDLELKSGKLSQREGVFLHEKCRLSACSCSSGRCVVDALVEVATDSPAPKLVVQWQL